MSAAGGKQPKKARLEVRIEQELLDNVNAKSNELGVTNSWIIRALIQNHLPSLSMLPYNPVQRTVGAVQSRTLAGDVRPPDPARARDTVSSPTTSKSINAPDAGEGAAAGGGAAELEVLLDRLDWYGAKFTAGSSPKVLAEKLVDTYPKVDHQQTAKEASAWLLAHPAKRKQYVARFLVGWFKNASKPPPWEPQTQLTVDRRPLAEQRRRAEDQRHRRQLEERKRELEERGPPMEPEETSRLAGEMADALGKAGPMSAEMESILERVTARSEDDG